ncbi:hypothetical protein E1287_07250 [Actinomadura sp. KC06]|uniref:hypothetical protein n=1 Tax=Actinomadura sp. KC06 TaxID=2530369 RepID=UPI00104398D7|nr:hypothetical protein [Actinomadura sp. KC06]TDD37846.1 hypothetical protein E1287_07250 [Actinomadura sp. KC06]
MTDDEAAPVRQVGAVWCADHDRWECVKNRRAKRGGGRCHQPAIPGLDRCYHHAGFSAEVAKAQGEAMDAWTAAYHEVAVTPQQAIIGMLNMSWFRANFYAGLLEEQALRAQSDREENGEPYVKGAPPVGEGAGLIGHTYSADKEYGIFASGEAIRGLVQLEAQERDRVVKYAKVAHEMGIAERQIQLAEQQGAMLAGAVRKILDGLNLTPDQQQLVPQLVPSVLRALASGHNAA